MPNLWGYARDLFQTPGFGDTTDFDQIKEHYYVVHTLGEPHPDRSQGPDLANWLEPHGRGGKAVDLRRRTPPGLPFARRAGSPGRVRPRAER